MERCGQIEERSVLEEELTPLDEGGKKKKESKMTQILA